MNESDMQHGEAWRGQDLSGWYITEKYDGCRAYWDGSNLWSRGGVNIQIPADMRAALPPHALDCELYDGRDGLGRCAVAIRLGRFTDSMRLVVFDVPDADGDHRQRLEASGVTESRRVIVAPLWVATSTADAQSRMMDIIADGGEGIMCSQPGRSYERARVRHLVKMTASVI